MFDLIGYFNFDGEDAPIAVLDLPGLQFYPGNVSPSSVAGRGLRARFAEHAVGKPSYHSDEGLHLFVVGEARLRSDAPIPDIHLHVHTSPLLGASDLLTLYQADSERFLRWLKGNFALVLVNEQSRQITLYNSRFGISPFYYALEGRRFWFSTGMAALVRAMGRQNELDRAGILELALFNYPLGDRTYFRPLKMLRPAEIVTATPGGLQRRLWWDVRSLYDGERYTERHALELGSDLFRKTVNDLAADVARLRISFTSGFDSRAILAVLDRDPGDVLAYSFGIPGSLNVAIPERICAHLGVHFQPIYLDADYERVFGEYALRAAILSDCLSTVERANYPYAFEKLAEFSPVIVTGLFGSELMRTFQNVGHIVSANLARLNLVHDGRAEFRRILASPDAFGYFSPELVRQAADQVEADLAATFFQPFGDLPSDRRFYMFLLTEALRKYFGAEVHMERPWGINRFPFLDDEFVEFAFRSPFAGVHSRTLRPTISNRLRSQYFYAFVIRKYRPELLKAPTDHGYAPGDVLAPFPLLKVAPQFLGRICRQRRSGYREFKTEEWTESLYQRVFRDGKTQNALFCQELVTDLTSGLWKKRHLDFAKAASFKVWLDMINEFDHV
ncbi:MAG: asparagine synthase-related protein [candidate division KSB1 bacterium]|nr:asparagine synthase-related protein [candidate division KSB1 bacterium]